MNKENTYGGGFIKDEGGKAAAMEVSPNKKRGDGVKGVMPVTIKQLLSVKPADDGSSEEKLLLEGRPVGQVSVVGLLIHKQEQNSFITMSLDDGTGIIAAKYWLSDAGKQQESEGGGEKKRSQCEEGKYVHVMAHIRCFQGNVTLHCHHIRLITDHNELSFHLAEALWTHMYFAKAGRQAPDHSAGFGTGFTAPVGASQQGRTAITLPGSVNVSGNYSAVQKDIISFVMRRNGDEGVHVSEIIQALDKSFTDVQVKNAIEYLAEEGIIYSTVDEEHFRYSAN